MPSRSRSSITTFAFCPPLTPCVIAGESHFAPAATIPEPPPLGISESAPNHLTTVLRHHLAGGVVATIAGAGTDMALRVSMRAAQQWMEYLHLTEFEKRLIRMESWFDKHRWEAPRRY